MLSRCISRNTIQSSRLFKSVNLNNLRMRNHHVIACASASFTGPAKIENKSQKSLVNKIVLSSPYLGCNRNFSLTPTIAASAVVAATETNTAATTTAAAIQIPNIPSVPETVVQTLAANGEPSIASLGLGGYSPVGLLQYGLEYLHVSCNLPWYAAIALSTVVIRILLTPLVVIMQRNSATMRNVTPFMQEIQTKMNEAKAMGDDIGYAQRSQELMKLMKEKGFNPMKNMLVPLAQMPIFLSYFIGIRRMVNAPVESMQTGGTLWFTDLTVADPYYLLPLITCSTLALTFHLGTEMAKSGIENPLMQYVIKGIPVIVFPLIMNFPSAMVVYWASSNFCSLIQGSIFKIPRVRTFFKIPQLIKFDMPPTKKKGFVEQMKETWKRLKSGSARDPRHIDQINFERAGTGPLVRTYKYDPTKTRQKASN